MMIVIFMKINICPEDMLKLKTEDNYDMYCGVMEEFIRSKGSPWVRSVSTHAFEIENRRIEMINPKCILVYKKIKENISGDF
jgi:hypothetical protein